MYNNQLVYKVVIWAFFGISLWTEKVTLNLLSSTIITLSSPLIVVNIYYIKWANYSFLFSHPSYIKQIFNVNLMHCIIHNKYYWRLFRKCTIVISQYINNQNTILYQFTNDQISSDSVHINSEVITDIKSQQTKILSIG